MTIERLNIGKKIIVVGIRLDGYTKELLDYTVMQVADLGDCVVAVHACQNQDYIQKERALLNGFLEDYQGLCSKKQVSLRSEVLKGNSLRKAVVKEAKTYAASAVVVGITKYTAFGGRASIAKYCAKRLPPTTEVTSIHNKEIIFSRCVRDSKPGFSSFDNFRFKDNHSEFGESEVSELARISYDTRGSLSSISLPVEDFTKDRPGWPLLKTASSITQPVTEAREMSVVKWVMNLPNRPSLEISENRDLAEIDKAEELSRWRDFPKDLEISYDVLKIATLGFSSGNLIGKGGSNSVYKGILPGGKQVAVKILDSSDEALKNFILEIDILTTLNHKRITPLIGICMDDNHLISVYDLLSKGNLEENLHGNIKETFSLPWEVRFRIAIGIAEALNYIHSKSPRPVIHRDVKSSNILLNDDLEPQLCDFGLAIWGPTTASFLTDNDVVGTFGYLAPEYFMYGKVSEKIDVYAFGVVLLELLSGRKPVGFETIKGRESLVVWARPKLENGDFKSLLDPRLNGNIDDSQIQRMGLAITLCLTQAARIRPKMFQILNILSGAECVNGAKLEPHFEDSEKHDGNDDEVYPISRAESHLSVAFLDVNDDYTSFSSMEQSSSSSIEDYLQKTMSRSSSLE